jgi:hypothetical protein
MRSAQVSGMLASFFTYFDVANPWEEIDIENLGRYSNETQFNIIAPTQNSNHVQRQTLAFNPHAAFHVYAIEWTPDYVAWQVDGVEVYRQTGAHVAQLVHPERLMMNIWQPSYVDWAGTFNPGNLPVYAYYDWVKYYAYTPGVGDNFTLQWTDDFNSFDSSRWQTATHTWDGNNSQFVQENVVFSNGYMILCLTDSVHSGYSGGAVVDTDIDPPYLVSARASHQSVRVLFSELLEKASAEASANYIIPGASVTGASLLADGRTVKLNVTGLNLSGSQTVVVMNVKDTTGNAMGAKSAKIIMPLLFPMKIDVGGAGANGYLADSIWNFSQQYGAVGGSIVQSASTLDIAGTTEDSVFRSALEGLTSYSVRVPTDRAYNVTLLMAETKYQESGKRVFDVTLNGSRTLHLDPYQLAGYATAYSPMLAGVLAPDGLLTLSFTAVADKPLLSGLIIDEIVEGVGESRTEPAIPRLGFSVFPNPFNPKTVVSYQLSVVSEVRLVVYDLLGREVAVLVNKKMPPGSYTVGFDGSGSASGVYFCSIVAGETRITKRVLLLR